jgi:hypothetical protein
MSVTLQYKDSNASLGSLAGLPLSRIKKRAKELIGAPDDADVAIVRKGETVDEIEVAVDGDVFKFSDHGVAAEAGRDDEDTDDANDVDEDETAAAEAELENEAAVIRSLENERVHCVHMWRKDGVLYRQRDTDEHAHIEVERYVYEKFNGVRWIEIGSEAALATIDHEDDREVVREYDNELAEEAPEAE